jgi:hypothetical protein
MRIRRTLVIILSGIFISLCTTGVVLAREMIQGEQCVVAADEVIEGTLFTFCQTLDVAGRVEGNIIGIALRARISGEVTESVYLTGTQLDLTGVIHRDLHFAGIILDLHSANETVHRPVKGQIIFATLSTTLADSVAIDGRVTGVGYQLLVYAHIVEEVNFWGSAFVLNDTIDNNVYVTVGNPESSGSDLEPLLIPLNITQEITDPGLLISTSGTINGTLTYHGPVMGDISGTVNGRINYSPSTPTIIPISDNDEGTINIFISQFTREITVLFTVGMAGLLFAPKTFPTPISNLRRRPLPSFVIGMLMFIVSFPIALILLLLTAIILLILALLRLDGVLIVAVSFLGLLDGTVIGVFYFLAIFIARAIFALGLGRFLIRLMFGHDGTQRTDILSLVAGVIVLAFLAALPSIGFLFNAAALFMGLGAITSIFLEWLQLLRNTTYTVQSPLSVEIAPSSDATSLPTHKPRALLPSSDDVGMRDLPDGFDPTLFFTDD